MPPGLRIQCRVTTETRPTTLPPTLARSRPTRSSGGYGIRLDGGNGYSGAYISPYYDSLLVKITCCDNTFIGACHKALRALSETRVRGVKTNIAFIANILTNPVFQAGKWLHEIHRRNAGAVRYFRVPQPGQQAAGIHRQPGGQRPRGRCENV